MPHPNRKFVLAYTFLVGLPILGLVGVLKSGRSLTPPYSVDGAWKIGTVATRDCSCTTYFTSLSNATLSISQSGTILVLVLGESAKTVAKTATGSLQGKVIRAQFNGDNSNSASCADRNRTLTAILDPQSEPRTLRGTLTFADRTSCRTDFLATHQPRNAAGDSH